MVFTAIVNPKINLLILIINSLFLFGDKERTASSPEAATAAPCNAIVAVSIEVDIKNPIIKGGKRGKREKEKEKRIGSK